MNIDMESEKLELEKSGMTLDEWFDEKFAQKMAEYNANRKRKLSILVTKGNLDWAYPPFIVGSTAAAMDWDVTMFFTFYGLSLLKNDLNPKVSAIGNTAMPMKMPFGPEWFRAINWNIPNIVQCNVPGFEALESSLMKETLRQKGVAPILELRNECVELGVEMLACAMTVGVFGLKKEDFFPGVSDWVGAATYLSITQDADVTLFM